MNSKYLMTLIFMVLSVKVHCQSIQQKKMQKLNHFVGDWVGISKGFENENLNREIPAYEKISYKVDRHILTIDLYSESLKLHTVIYYDEDEQTYVYNSFYKTGSAKYPAKLSDGKLIVSPSETKRFIFEITEEGKFREYGETLENGEWTIYFEDVFQKN